MQRSEWNNLKPGDYVYWMNRKQPWVVLSRAVRPPRPRGVASVHNILRINDWSGKSIAYCLGNADASRATEKSPVLVCDYMPGWYLASELDER